MANPNSLHQRVHSIESGKIEEFLSLKASQQALKERLSAVEAALYGAEEAIIALVDAGAESPPDYYLSVAETTRRYPKWKEVFIDCMGKQEADAVLAETEPTISRKLVIK